MSYDRAIPIGIAGQRNVATWRVNTGIKVTRRSDGNALHRSIRWADSVELKMTRPAKVDRRCPIRIENPDGAIHVVIRQITCFYVHASGEVNLGVDPCADGDRADIAGFCTSRSHDDSNVRLNRHEC